MTIWPEQIRLLSIPSVVCCTLFLWNAIVFCIFSRLLPVGDELRRLYFYFALTSLLLAAYTFGSVNLYSSGNWEISVFWQKWQFLFAIPLFVCFVLFSTTYLKISHPYWRWVVPILSLLFCPFVFWDGLFVQPAPSPKILGILGYRTRILEGKMGYLALVFFAWVLPHILYLGVRWLRTYRRRPYDLILLVAVSIFAAAVVNDVFVSLEIFRFFYVLELGFVALVIAMSFQMFHEYLEKSREVDRLNEEMRFLMGTISHDFQSPLLSIEGFSDRLKEVAAASNGQFDHCLERIQVNSRHLRELVSELSDYLKIGRVEEARGPVETGKVWEEVCGLLDVPRNFPQARLESPEQWPRLHVSEKRLKQIFINLLQNALKYSEPDQTWIRMRWQEQGAGVLFYLEDKGPGIPPELSEKIFEPFFRGIRHQPGSGLGLAIAKKSVEALGGRIWLDPEYHEGARFCFWIAS